MRPFRDELSDATRVITKQRYLKTVHPYFFPKGVSLFVFHLRVIITFQNFVINQLIFGLYHDLDIEKEDDCVTICPLANNLYDFKH